MPNLYTFRMPDRFTAYSRNAAGWYTEGNQAIEEANRLSIEWLGQRSAAILKRKARRRVQDTRNAVTLAQMVQNPEASRITADGFAFLDTEKVAALNLRASRYYRAVESGSSYWVGREIRLLFFGPGGPGRQQARGSHTRAWPRVVIEHPVPEYLYATEASDKFVKSNQWFKFARAELRRRGIDNVRSRA